MSSPIGRWAQAPDQIEPLVGYRAWRSTFDEAGAHLLPFGWREVDDWVGAEQGWVTSSCRRSPDVGTHRSPDENCSCGFYATKSLYERSLLLAVWMDLAGETSDSTGIVLGRVDLAGKVIEHDLGYRAERARIVGLIPTSADDGITAQVAVRLGLGVGPAVELPGPRLDEAGLDETSGTCSVDQAHVDALLRPVFEQLGVNPDRFARRDRNSHLPC
jgi:hypothetical protein